MMTDTASCVTFQTQDDPPAIRISYFGLGEDDPDPFTITDECFHQMPEHESIHGGHLPKGVEIQKPKNTVRVYRYADTMDREEAANVMIMQILKGGFTVVNPNAQPKGPGDGSGLTQGPTRGLN